MHNKLTSCSPLSETGHKVISSDLIFLQLVPMTDKHLSVTAEHLTTVNSTSDLHCHNALISPSSVMLGQSDTSSTKAFEPWLVTRLRTLSSTLRLFLSFIILQRCGSRQELYQYLETQEALPNSSTLKYDKMFTKTRCGRLFMAKQFSAPSTWLSTSQLFIPSKRKLLASWSPM